MRRYRIQLAILDRTAERAIVHTNRSANTKFPSSMIITMAIARMADALTWVSLVRLGAGVSE